MPNDSFSAPQISMKMADYMHLAKLWKESSSCVGMCCELEKRFFEVGIKSVDNVIRPRLHQQLLVMGCCTHTLLSFGLLNRCLFSTLFCC